MPAVADINQLSGYVFAQVTQVHISPDGSVIKGLQ